MTCSECGKQMQGRPLLDHDEGEYYCSDCADFQGYYGQLTRLQVAVGLIGLIGLIALIGVPVAMAIVG